MVCLIYRMMLVLFLVIVIIFVICIVSVSVVVNDICFNEYMWEDGVFEGIIMLIVED